MRRDADATGAMDGMDAFTEQAFGLLTSSRLAEALDLSKEPPKVVERYGTGNPKMFMDGNGAPRVPQSLLMARRLVEAGARVVTLNYSKWDWHGGLNAEGRANNSIFLREQEDFPSSTSASARWSKTCTTAGWTRTARWSSWASSAARRRSAPRSAATTGRR